MINICHRIDLILDEHLTFYDLHGHLLIDENLEAIPLKLYLGEDFEAKSKSVMEWLYSKPDYTEFAKNIMVKKIQKPTGIVGIDYHNNSAIANIIPHGTDDIGDFLIVSFKDVTVRYAFDTKHNEGNLRSTIYLDNHAFDLFNTLIQVDSFISHSRIWRSRNPYPPIPFGEYNIRLDVSDQIANDADHYPQLIKRTPVIFVDHGETSEANFIELTNLLTAALSFFQGHGIDYFELSYLQENMHGVAYRKRKKKEKILNKNLGRFRIRIGLYEFISQLSPRRINQGKFVNELVSIFNQSIQSSGTTEFMLLFTVVEKLRDHLTKHRDESKFTFIPGKKDTNSFIKTRLEEIRDIVADDEREIFNSAINGKIRQIKFKPQEDQFIDLFEVLATKPDELELEWGKIVNLRGEIFHGLYIDPDEKWLKELNSKFTTFTGNLIYRFLILPG